MRAAETLVVMAVAAALSAGPAADAAGAQPCSHRGRRCSTPPIRPSGPGASTQAGLAGVARLAPGERVVVPVVYHVMYGSLTPAPPESDPDDLAHAPPLALVDRQTEALNRAFRGTGFSFVTEEAQHRSFEPWGGAGSRFDGQLAAMIRDLTADRPASLHVFLMRDVDNRASAAETRTAFPDERDTDAIVMDWDYLPYVEALRPIPSRLIRRFFFAGETLVHLVGHYLGLLHTFEPWPLDGATDCNPPCAQTSDHVRDTPVHRLHGDPPGKCLPRDTCKAFAGMDPVTNYMNLEPDLCASEFTSGQVARMERMVRTFRCHLIQPRPADCR